jgi:predicted peptidase
MIFRAVVRILTGWLFLGLTMGFVRGQAPEKTSPAAPSRAQKHALSRDVSHRARLEYLTFLPKGYANGGERWPLILYLHGGSQRGNDIDRMKRWGIAEKAETDPEFPFIVVAPQCPQGEIWTDVDALAAVLDEVMQTCRVDPDRVYVSGHSMGGRGALYAAYKMPERFAGAVAMSPVFPITAWGEKLAGVPLWIFHGANDQFTPVKEVEELVQAIAKAGGKAEFTVLSDRDHYILDLYNRPDIYKWLAEQRRRKPEK